MCAIGNEKQMSPLSRIQSGIYLVQPKVPCEHARHMIDMLDLLKVSFSPAKPAGGDVSIFVKEDVEVVDPSAAGGFNMQFVCEQ